MAKINPNRMELLRLKKRAATAVRGHKLLKDKLDALMQRLLSITEEARRLRSEVEDHLSEAFGLLTMARGEAGTLVLTDALAGATGDNKVGVDTVNIMSVRVPSFSPPKEAPRITYSLATTPALLDVAVASFYELLGKLIRLSELEKTIELLAFEVDRTRRRVNALEYIFIPKIQADIKQIQMSLEELERANLIRVMKTKEIVAEKS